MNILVNSSLTEMLLVSFLVIASAVLAQYLWKKRKVFAMAAKIPGPPGFPIIGNLIRFYGDTEHFLKETSKISNTYVLPPKIWFGHRLFFVIHRPEDLDIIFNSPYCLGKGDAHKFGGAILGEGLGIAPVPKWKKHRKIIAPTFNVKILNTFVEVFARHATVLTAVLKEKSGNDFDIFEHAQKWSLNILCETSMGLKVNAQAKKMEFGKLVQRIMTIGFERLFQIWNHPDFIFFNTPAGREFTYLQHKLRGFTENVVREKRATYLENKQLAKEFPEAQIENVKGKMKPFLDLLIELSEEGVSFTDVELIDEVMTFLAAGSDSTATVTSFTFVMMAMHPDVQQKVYEEAMDVLGPDKEVEYSDLPNLKYTERVIKETNRLFPIGPFVVRSNDVDIQLKDCILPAESTLALHILHIHRSAQYWPDPLKFDPDRFLPEETAKRHTYAYMPFTGGPRNCIGQKYAMMAIMTMVAHMIRKFRLSTHYKNVADIRLKQDMVLKTVEGFKLRINTRIEWY